MKINMDLPTGKLFVVCLLDKSFEEEEFFISETNMEDKETIIAFSSPNLQKAISIIDTQSLAEPGRVKSQSNAYLGREFRTRVTGKFQQRRQTHRGSVENHQHKV